LLADGIGCCNRMVVRRAAPSSLRMIIRSIVEAARGLDNVGANRPVEAGRLGPDWDNVPCSPGRAKVACRSGSG
jgi:hypothetical protein